MMRQPLATIHGARVGEATPARAVMPGTGSASRDATSAAESAAAETRTFDRVAALCIQQRHASAASNGTLCNVDVFHGNPGAVVYAEAERRRVLDVPGLTRDDVDVRIGVARAGVVDLQRGRRAVPDRDRAVRA